MPTRNFVEAVDGDLGEMRLASTNNGGAALTTVPIGIPFPPGTRHVFCMPRNLAGGATIVHAGFCPYLTVFKTADGLATIPTDASVTVQDGVPLTATSFDISSLDTLANLDAIWLGAAVPFRGLFVDVVLANSTVSALAAHYTKSDGTMATLAPTDGTASGGATFAIDGNITWTLPTDWQSISLKQLFALSIDSGLTNQPRYWCRLSVSAALDASTTLATILALQRSAITSVPELVSGQALSRGVLMGPDGYAGVESFTDAGTANLIVNCAAGRGSTFDAA